MVGGIVMGREGGVQGSDAVGGVCGIVDVSSVGIWDGGGWGGSIIIIVGWVGNEHSLHYWCVVVGLLRRHVPVLQTKRGCWCVLE